MPSRAEHSAFLLDRANFLLIAVYARILTAIDTISCVSRGYVRTNSIRLWHSRTCATFTSPTWTACSNDPLSGFHYIDSDFNEIMPDGSKVPQPEMRDAWRAMVRRDRIRMVVQMLLALVGVASIPFVVWGRLLLMM